MVQFCMAYCGILAKHNLCSTGTTGKFVSEATGLKIEKFLSGTQGGEEQISARVMYNEIDMVLFFRDPYSNAQYEPDVHSLVRLCDMHNIPIATNMATAGDAGAGAGPRRLGLAQSGQFRAAGKVSKSGKKLLPCGGFFCEGRGKVWLG